MLSFQVSWADDPQSQVTIEARSPYKAYRAFLKREGHSPEVVVEVRRGAQIDTFTNHFEKPKDFWERARRSDPDPKSREAIYGKSDNDDLGCFLLFLGGPLPFRLITLCVVGVFLIAFQKQCPDSERSGNTGMGELDGQGREIGQWTWKHSHGENKTQGNFDGGKRVGPWVWWREDGTKETVEVYRDGKLEGLCTDWYRNGQKSREKIYISGSLRSAVVWLPDGTKCPKTNLKEGSGVMYEYGEDGTPQRYLRFKNGKEQGGNRFFRINTVQ
jgi:hypothetical protein